MQQAPKFNAAMSIAKEICNSMKYLTQNDFEKHLSELVRFNELLKKREPFGVVSDCVQKITTSGDETRPSTSTTADNSDSTVSTSNTTETTNTNDIATITTTTTTTGRKNLATMTAGHGTGPGRKADKRRKINHSNGQLSLYTQQGIIPVEQRVSTITDSSSRSTRSSTKTTTSTTTSSPSTTSSSSSTTTSTAVEMCPVCDKEAPRKNFRAERCSKCNRMVHNKCNHSC